MPECNYCMHENVCKLADQNVSAGTKVRETIHGCVNYKPTSDVVEVVRCKDCKYGEHYKCSVDPCYNHMKCVRRENYTEGIDEYDYCSYGERKPPTARPD